MTKQKQQTYKNYAFDPSKCSCWIIVEKGLRGTENQAIGLAQHLSVSFEQKRIELKQPWKTLGSHFPIMIGSAFTPESDSLDGPYPDLVITAGRKAALAARYLKTKMHGTGTFVHIMKPQGDAKLFDLIITPQHDQFSGKNVLQTVGALHHVTIEKLSSEAKQFKKKYAPLPRPRIAVLIGGSSQHYQMTKVVTERLAAQLKTLAKAGNGLMITASRRTGEENSAILREALAAHANVDYWDGDGANPYFGMLGLADIVLVTEDSASMATEACATGKPTYVIKLEGGSPKFQRFHQAMQTAGHTRIFSGSLDNFTPTPLGDLDHAKERIYELLSINFTAF